MLCSIPSWALVLFQSFFTLLTFLFRSFHDLHIFSTPSFADVFDTKVAVKQEEAQEKRKYEVQEIQER